MQGIRLEMANHPETKRGFVLLPRRRVVKCSVARATRIRRLVKDYERLPETIAGLHFVSLCLFNHPVSSLLNDFSRARDCSWQDA